MFQRLGIRRRPCQLLVEGVGATTNTSTRGTTEVRMNSLCGWFSLELKVLVLKSITSTTPVTEIDSRCWSHLRDIELADPTFGTPGRIDLLLGADIWGSILKEGVIRGQQGEPCAIRTQLGWVVFGPAKASTSFAKVKSFVGNNLMEKQQLDELIRRFWEIEEPTTTPLPKNDVCEMIFQRTVSRGPDGRFIVQIPFRPDAPPIGNSHNLALRQFYQLERKLVNDVELREKYVQFMREYIELDHMEAIGVQKGDNSSYFIPHHAVTDKFRVVFNASAKSKNGTSLNDAQLVGPQIQDVLVNIIHRFRRFKIAITADVEKMFRQVLVDERHRKWQQILWRESPSDPLRIYQLKTVTYGMACGPFNAIRALQQCAMEDHMVITDKKRAIVARDSVLNDFYVDDFLTSVGTQMEAIELARDITKVLQQGRFRLRKFNSNCWHTLTGITGSGESRSTINLSESDTTVLGLQWNPVSDELFYKITVEEINVGLTKRVVLRDVGRLYDPLGLLAPVIIIAKIFIQSLWKLGLDWDELLPWEVRNEWMTFRNSLLQLANLRVPRWLGMKPAATITLHGFCDASQKAYAAVMYVRSVDTDGQIHVALISSKTRVAPVKELTIPRLELCAAHLLVRLLISLQESMQLNKVKYELYSDSSIVLSWIRKPAATLKQYVSNRVAYIQQHTEARNWHHIRSQVNPADCASRGMPSLGFVEHELWWNGPSCIRREIGKEKKALFLTESEDAEFSREIKPLPVLVGTGVRTGLETWVQGIGRLPLVQRFSSLKRLLHTTAYVMRFRPGAKYLRGLPFVTSEESADALLLHIREAQSLAFNNEINSLRSCSSIDVSSKLRSLNPILDKSGVLRVGGRLQKAELPFDQRHPMILPKDAPLSRLIVNDAHQMTLHGEIQMMLEYLRQRFWILNSRALVKSYVQCCVKCKLQKKVMQRQQMASLPRVRVLVSPPFLNTGIDYAGPFQVKQGGPRSTVTMKTYAAIFVCMSTKAVHIELAVDLSSRSFIDVFDRFISRRGCCKNLYSDNGTQFTGASRIMRRDLKNWSSMWAKQHISDAGVNWNFIAPAAPHHGGLWEAAVRSAKKHLLKVIGAQVLRFCTLSTLLTRIEACLNSRPIVALHDDPETGTALTPGDFLIGRPLIARPEAAVPEVPENRLKYYEQMQRMYQHFWRRWQTEYLSSLQARSKWTRPEPNVQVNDVVAIQHENLPPSRWRIGRVIQVHPGSDGLVRVVTIEYNSDTKKPNGLFVKHQCQRPVQKVCRIAEATEEF